MQANPPDQEKGHPPDLNVHDDADTPPSTDIPTFKALGWLDRFLALWIFLAMALGIILGNFVPNTAEALEQGTFVGVSVPIGLSPSPPPTRSTADS
jgi:ACR3 family arsenite transporter